MSAAEQKRRRAQTLTPELLNHLLRHVQGTSADPLRDYAVILLSFKAALRVGEIAGLNWQDVTDPLGKVGKPRRNPVTGDMEAFFEVPSYIAKKGNGRLIPMHAALQATLEHLRAATDPWPPKPHDPVIRGLRNARVSPNALAVYLKTVYKRAGLNGCSSHSGRRTAITELCQNANTHGCSLMDVQRLAGHRGIETTEVYVEASPHFGKMVRAL